MERMEWGGRQVRGREEEEGRATVSYLFVNVWYMCLGVLHLNKPLLAIPVSDSITIGEGTGGTHV